MAYYDNPLAPPNTGDMDKYLKKTEAAEAYVPKNSETNQIQASSSVMTMGAEMKFESNEFIFRTWEYSGDVLTIGNGIARYLGKELATKSDIPEDKVFYAEWRVTSYADIMAAFNSGKVCYVKCSESNYPLLPMVAYNSTTITFKAVGGINDYDRFYYVNVFANASQVGTVNGWSNYASVGIEAVSRKVTSLTSASTDAQYPSARAVYSYVNNAVGDVHAALQELLGGEMEAIV